MDDYIYIGFPNEGEVLLSVRLVYSWDMSDFNLIGNTVFFRVGGDTFSIRLEDFNTHFKKKYEQFLG